jgi:hypothetical protein
MYGARSGTGRDHTYAPNRCPVPACNTPAAARGGCGHPASPASPRPPAALPPLPQHPTLLRSRSTPLALRHPDSVCLKRAGLPRGVCAAKLMEPNAHNMLTETGMVGAAGTGGVFVTGSNVHQGSTSNIPGSVVSPAATPSLAKSSFASSMWYMVPSTKSRTSMYLKKPCNGSEACRCAASKVLKGLGDAPLRLPYCGTGSKKAQNPPQSTGTAACDPSGALNWSHVRSASSGSAAYNALKDIVGTA